MQYQLTFEQYRRHFKIPLKTSHGLWSVREGLIVSLTDEDGRQTQGEIAPLPWFGTETLAEAISLCESYRGFISAEAIREISDQFPACQFGFETAMNCFGQNVLQLQLEPKDCCQLLTPAMVTEEAVNELLAQDFRSFKLKIAMESCAEEQQRCEQLRALLPSDAQLRLDANGGLTFEDARQWLTWGDRQSQLEFIEQPLSPDKFQQMLQLQRQYQTTIALDESVTNLNDLEKAHHNGWQGIYVIKVAIAGFPSRLKKLCQNYDLDLVFSTVFETSVGQQALLQLAATLGTTRALGMGGQHWFTETDN